MDLCQDKEDPPTDEDLLEEFECDQYGNDISLLGSPGKKQVNMNPVFNINFVVENKNDLENIKNWLSSAHMQKVIEPLSKDNVIDVEDLKKYIKNSDTQKKFTINVSPKEVSNNESEELNDDNDGSFEEDDNDLVLF